MNETGLAHKNPDSPWTSARAKPNPFWTAFLRKLARRGLRGVKLVVSDAHEGIKAAVSKLYSWHAPETDCIGKGKAHKPYEFGCKVSITTTNRRSSGGQFVLHAKALPGNPYDGRTLAEVIGETEALTGCAVERAYVDKGYRGHDAPRPRSVFISGQKRGVHGIIKREIRRRSAIEPVIGHMKTDGHLGCNFLKGYAGDQANAVLTAVGYNFRLILRWLRLLLRLILMLIVESLRPSSPISFAS